MNSNSTSKPIHWIAERVFLRRDMPGTRVIVRIGAPEKDEPHPDWRCPFVIEGLDNDSIRFGHGIDSMNALQNTLIGIRAVLNRSRVRLTWALTKTLDLGFPMTIPTGYGKRFERRLEKMVAVEIEELVRPIRERREGTNAKRNMRKKKAK